MTGDRQRVLLLSGGVGGAKLAHGYALLDDRVDLTVVVNTGDDFEHLGLSISPDIDTVLYTLGGIANQSQGWGIEGESWRTLDRLRELGGEDWFRLGDLDIATHLYRTAALASGRRLTEIVLELAERLGVRARVLPASDDKVRTRLHTDEGELAFQNYFVRQACRPRVRSISIAGAEHASLTPELTRVLGSVGEPLDAVILAPSNPFLSLAPILAIPQLSDLLRGACGRIVAVSPIIAGAAVKGPAAKLMNELGLDVSAKGWAKYLADRYAGLVDEWVLDEQDEAAAAELAAEGFRTRTGSTLMRSVEDRRDVAGWLLEDTCRA